MPLCHTCGLQLNEEGICPHHFTGDKDWAEGNKRWCDWLHRGVEPPRLPKEERDEEHEWWREFTGDTA